MVQAICSGMTDEFKRHDACVSICMAVGVFARQEKRFASGDGPKHRICHVDHHHHQPFPFSTAAQLCFHARLACTAQGAYPYLPSSYVTASAWSYRPHLVHGRIMACHLSLSRLSPWHARHRAHGCMMPRMAVAALKVLQQSPTRQHSDNLPRPISLPLPAPS